MRNNMRFVFLQLVLCWRVISTLYVTEETISSWNTTANSANETEENKDFRFVAVTTLAEEINGTETVANLADVDFIKKDKPLDEKNVTVSVDAACGPPPQVDNAVPANRTEGSFPLGSVVVYACELGFVATGGRRSTTCHRSSATQRVDWTTMQLKCNPRSCGDPGYVVNGRVTGYLFTFPHNVTFHCDEGYKRRGHGARFCQANGEWSGTLPTCEKVRCSVPTSPLHGRIIFSSLEYGSELKYECDQGFRLDSKEPRLCTQEARWSGHQPTCSEMHCDPPIAPQKGSVQILDQDLKVGSIIVYSCDEGGVLVGSARSTCSKDGHWVFPAPTCVEPCRVPRIPNGEMGKYVKQGWRTQFVESRVGDTLAENEEQIIRCHPNHFIAGTHIAEAQVRCSDGKWPEDLTCVSSSCAAVPPATQNGYVYIKDDKHGGTITYLCNDLFKKTKHGNVTCLFGQWEGITPVCEKEDCLLSELNDPGLAESHAVYKNGRSYDPSCKSGYETSRVRNWLQCRNGAWTGHFPACQPASCRSDPPRIANGRGIPDCRTHECTTAYSCLPSFSLEGSSKVQCLYGAWDGDPPTCRSVKCIVPRISHGEIGRYVADYSGTTFYQKSRFGEEMQAGAEYILRCNVNYYVLGRRNTESSFLCTNGAFSETLQCASSSCSDDPPPTKNADVSWKVSEHNGTVTYRCHANFEKKKSGNVTCLFGRWEGVTPICDGASSMTSAKEKEIPVISDHHTAVQLTTAVTAGIQTFEPEPECACEYNPSDSNLVAHSNGKKIEFGWKISRGAKVMFYCQRFEFLKLVGQPETVCEHCGQRLYTPSCREPNYEAGDTAVVFGGNVHSGNGFLEVERGGLLQLTCYAHVNAAYGYPKWTRQSSSTSRPLNGVSDGYRYQYLEITSFDEQHSGDYKCRGHSLNPTILNVRVVDVECSELVPSHNLTIHYTDNRRVGSTATFHCFEPLKLEGPDALRCLKGGSWSGDTPSCVHPTCSVESLYSLLTDYMYPVMEGVTGDTVPSGSNVTLQCEDGHQFSRPAMAACDADGKWTLPNLRCISGCGAVSKAPGSSLIVEPQQDFYRVGEYISLSCPEGLQLTSEIQVIMCFGREWSETDVPDCRPPTPDQGTQSSTISATAKLRRTRK